MTTPINLGLSPHAWEQMLAEAWVEAKKRSREAKDKAEHGISWPALSEYRNSETGYKYEPHSEAELAWVQDTTSTNLWALGGEGAGKSVLGVIRDLERAKAGCAGALTSPDFEHFKRSLWPELRRWIPWDLVIQRHRYRASASWEPQRPFTLVFLTGSAFFLGGMQESDVQAWEGPNLNFWHFDEIRRHRTDAALKVIHGRVRVPGPNGEKPQRWYTTTPLPRGSWMFKYTGPIPEEKEQRLQDPRLRYKLDRLIVNLKTKDNLAHLTPGFIEERSQVLTESEIQLLLEGLQVDVADTEAFLPTISLWDECRGVVPPLDDRTPIVIALDAAIGRASGLPDCFGLVGVSRQKDRPDDLAVRIVRKWQAEPGKKLDFHADNGPIPTLRFLCEHHAVAAVPYDPYQLHSDCTQLAKEGFAWFMEFHQGADRLEADRALFDRILARGIIHDGNADLRQHLENAGRKLDQDGRRMRIVQRDPDLKVDLSVCLSMSCHTAARLAL